MIQEEYFKKWLDEKFLHLENKIDAFVADTTDVNKRVNNLEEDVRKLNTHQAKDEGMWKAYGRLATIGGGLMGGLIAWLTNKFL